MVRSGQLVYLEKRPASILWQVESLEGIEAILIDKEGHLSCSSEFLYRNNVSMGFKIVLCKERKSHVKTYCYCWNEFKTFYKPPIASIHAKHFAEKAEIELVEIKDIPVFNKTS